MSLVGGQPGLAPTPSIHPLHQTKEISQKTPVFLSTHKPWKCCFWISSPWQDSPKAQLRRCLHVNRRPKHISNNHAHVYRALFSKFQLKEIQVLHCVTYLRQSCFLQILAANAVFAFISKRSLTEAEPPRWFSRPVILSILWLVVLDTIQLEQFHTSSKERA